MSKDKQLPSIEPETPDGLTLESLAQDLGENLFYYCGMEAAGKFGQD